jgi:hypothetical protein
MITLLNVVPTSGTLIAADTLVQFEVRTPTAAPFRRILVAFEFTAYQTTELAYAQDPAGVDGHLFDGLYAVFSTVETVTDIGFFRYRFKVLRAPLWPDSPKLIVYAFDTLGAEL